MQDLARVLEARAPLEPIDVVQARHQWRAFRVANGFGPNAPILSPPDSNVKLHKSGKPDYGVSLAPSDLSGEYNVCRFATRECRAGCVAFAGKGELAGIIRARQLKTRFLAEHPQAFVTLLGHEISRQFKRHGELAVRLNVFSDLRWEILTPWLFEANPHVRFYDYTKWPVRVPPANYDITFSISERVSDTDSVTRTQAGERIAVVFSTKRGQALPTSWQGVPVIDGDKTDQRFNDPTGVVVGLRAKGRMRKGNWKMVRKVGV